MEIAEFALLKADSVSYVSLLPNELIRYIIAFIQNQWMINENDCELGYRIMYFTTAYNKIDCISQFLKAIIEYENGEYLCLCDKTINRITGKKSYSDESWDDIISFAKKHIESRDGLIRCINILEAAGIIITNKIESLSLNYNR